MSGPPNANRSSPVLESHIRAIPPGVAVTIRDPSGENLAQCTTSSCPLNVNSFFQAPPQTKKARKELKNARSRRSDFREYFLMRRPLSKNPVALCPRNVYISCFPDSVFACLGAYYSQVALPPKKGSSRKVGRRSEALLKSLRR